MNSRTEILNELQDLNSNLPPNAGTNPYRVPNGYFEGLAGSILLRIREEKASSEDEIASLSPLLAGISRKMPFEVPDNYFNSTNLSGITDDERLPFNLEVADRNMPFEVPEGYFETLPDIILARIEKPKSNVVSLRARRWMRIAAAAVIAGVVAISGFLYLNNRNTVSIDNPEWMAKKLKNVETKELEEFIQETDITIARNTSKQVNSKDITEVKSMLKDVSNEELKTFLDQIPADEEVDMSMLN
jgi:hypothetical protein